MIGRRIRPSAAEAEKPKGFDDYELRLGDLMRGERATLGKSLLDVQRELKIKATYIAAIENCDVSAFETQGFVAGYVRSYARYLQMDPEWAYTRFCDEADFTPTHGMSSLASPAKPAAAKAKLKPEHRDPLANPNATFVPRGPSLMSGVEPRAIGSVLVLLALIGGLGYGGWSVLQQVQRVQVAPVDQSPGVVAALDPLAHVAKLASAGNGKDAGVSVPSADALDRLYRPQPLDVPVMVPRDGPIATINPDAQSTVDDTKVASGTSGDPSVAAALAAATGAVQDQSAATTAAAGATPAADGTPKVVADAAPKVQLMAVRPSWVRVTASDGTVLFEKILDAGEKWTVPQTEQPAKLRAGNSGSLYFLVNGKAYGPAAPGANVVKNLALSVDNLKSSYVVADLKRDPALAKAVAMADASQTATPQPTAASH